VFHGNLTERYHTGQRAPSADLPADHIWTRHSINLEIVRRWDVLLIQWKVVYRWTCVKEYVLFWSRNALHQLQAVLFAEGVLFFHSRECLHSFASTRDCVRFTETHWSDHRHRTKTPGLCFNHPRGLIKQISPANCQITESTSHVPPETVIYWITVTHITLSHGQLWGSLITVWFILYRPRGRNFC